MTLDDLPNLALTRQVFDETLRLYPPLWSIIRRAVADDEIDGYHIPAHSQIIISPYIMHRHPSYWRKPETFDPTHFDKSQKRHKLSYIPFGLGHRSCIAGNFAIMQSVLIIAMLARHFRFELVKKKQIKPRGLISLKPKRPIMVKAILI